MNFFKQLLNNKIVKNSIILVNGTIIAQVVNVLLSPIMSRLYTPTDFGNYSSISALVIIIAVIANGKYDLAIMSSDENSIQRKATYYVGMILTLISTLLIIVIGSMLVICIPSIEYSILDIFMIAIFTFFTSHNSTINIWLNKNGNYKQISANRVLYAVIHACGIIVFGLLKLGYIGILFSTLCAYFIQYIYVYAFLYRHTEFKQLKCSWSEIKEQAKKHIKFPKFQMPALLCNNASTQMPVILFKSLFNADVSGWYSMTIKIISLPMSIIGNAIGEVFFKEASEIKAKGDSQRLKTFTYNTFKKLAILGLIPMCALLGYGDILFSFVLGEKWQMAGIYAMLLAPWYYVVFVTSPFTHLFTVLEKQRKNLVLNIIMLLSRVFSILLGIMLFGQQDNIMTILIFAIVGFFIWLGTNGYVFKMVGIPYRKSVLNTILYFVGASIICVLPRVIWMII